MAKFRKKPVVVEAVQYFPEIADTIKGVFKTGGPIGAHHVITAHDQMAFLAPGDWVITEPDGIHHYPCKPDIFAATYEPVLEEPPAK